MKKREAVMEEIRSASFTTPTSGIADGYAQANLVVLDKAYAFDFLVYCERNKKKHVQFLTLRMSAHRNQY